jgi:hypothetical protein
VKTLLECAQRLYSMTFQFENPVIGSIVLREEINIHS